MNTWLRSAVMMLLVSVAGGRPVLAAADEVRAEFLAAIERGLPKRGSLFIDFKSPNAEYLGVRVGFDFATGAYFRVFRDMEVSRAALRQPDGRLFAFDDRTKAFEPLTGEVAEPIEESRLNLVVPALALWNVSRYPESILDVTRTATGYRVRIDPSGLTAWDRKTRNMRGSSSLEQMYSADLSLEREIQDGNEWLMERVEGIPAILPLPRRTRGGWVLQKAEFVPLGAPDRFMLDAVRLAAEPLRGGSVQAVRRVPTLTEAASGKDQAGRPIVVGQSPEAIRTDRSFDWRLVGVAGALFVAVGFGAWWRKR